MQFWLGTHNPRWLERTPVPLFVSRRRLFKLNKLPSAVGPYAIDSGGFTELNLYGGWTISPQEYVAELRRYQACIGPMSFCAPMDWMCEPEVIRRTGLTVEDHQRLSLENYLELRSLAPELPFIPVLQGWTIGDYWRHQEAHDRAGIDLKALPLVGVGTVCRRQATTSVGALLATLKADGLKVHVFGMKSRGLVLSAHHVESADSLAWSYRARRAPPMEGCPHPHCNNCMRFALAWRERLINALEPELRPPAVDLSAWDRERARRVPAQGRLFD